MARRAASSPQRADGWNNPGRQLLPQMRCPSGARRGSRPAQDDVFLNCPRSVAPRDEGCGVDVLRRSAAGGEMLGGGRGAGTGWGLFWPTAGGAAMLAGLALASAGAGEENAEGWRSLDRYALTPAAHCRSLNPNRTLITPGTEFGAGYGDVLIGIDQDEPGRRHGGIGVFSVSETTPTSPGRESGSEDGSHRLWRMLRSRRVVGRHRRSSLA
jgi:hypothetical protein